MPSGVIPPLERLLEWIKRVIEQTERELGSLAPRAITWLDPIEILDGGIRERHEYKLQRQPYVEDYEIPPVDLTLEQVRDMSPAQLREAIKQDRSGLLPGEIRKWPIALPDGVELAGARFTILRPDGTRVLVGSPAVAAIRETYWMLGFNGDDTPRRFVIRHVAQGEPPWLRWHVDASQLTFAQPLINGSRALRVAALPLIPVLRAEIRARSEQLPARALAALRAFPGAEALTAPTAADLAEIDELYKPEFQAKARNTLVAEHAAAFQLLEPGTSPDSGSTRKRRS